MSICILLSLNSTGVCRSSKAKSWSSAASGEAWSSMNHSPSGAKIWMTGTLKTWARSDGSLKSCAPGMASIEVSWPHAWKSFAFLL